MNKFIEAKASAKSISKRGFIFEVGINDADYVVNPKINGKRVICPHYQKWVNMITRCYSEKYQARQPAYIGTTIAAEWLTFSAFKAWMEKQDWEGNELDKDIIKPGNKLYSPETCCFVPKALNSLLNSNGATRGDYPQGVSFHNHTSKYIAHCSFKGKNNHLGLFCSPEEASLAYRKYKHALVRQIASEQVDPMIMRGLVIHADLILRGIEL